VAKVIVDFSNVKQGNFNPAQVPEGDYVAKITKAEIGQSKAGNQQIVFTLQLEGKRGTYPYYCGLVENQLWKLRNILVAAGITVPKKKLNIDPDKVLGRSVGVEMTDDEYEGRIKSIIASVFAASEVTGAVVDEDAEPEDDEDEEEAPAPVARKKATKVAPAPVEEDEDEEDEEPAPAPVARKKKAAPAPVANDDEDEDELDVDEI
jgi:hypothetical protein